MTAEDRARRVEMLLMDVDGTLTDGTILILPDGEEVRSYHVADGLGILLAQMAGLRAGIITGKESRSVATRAKRLRLAEVVQGAIDKKQAFDGILARHELAAEKVAFIGDDLGDLSVLRAGGPGTAPVKPVCLSAVDLVRLAAALSEAPDFSADRRAA